MRKTAYYSASIILWAWTGLAMSATIYVPADYAVIQAAIDAANNGDEIEVARGAYFERIDFGGKAVRLFSRDGAAATTVDGGGAGPVIRCVRGEAPSTILEGFTITGGSAHRGGGMYNLNSSPSVTDCFFTGNYASEDGGGMTNRNSSPTVTYCTFTGNSAGDAGGGMHNREDSHPIVTGCTFEENLADDGGGMQNFLRSSPTVDNCTFMGNLVSGSTSSNGGGIDNTYSSNPTITNCTFTGNSAHYGGGMLSGWSSSPTIANCVFVGNSAQFGGGMFNVDSSPTVRNCTFTGNSVPAGRGGGMYSSSSSSTTAVNCIFWSNSGGEVRGPAIITYSDVEGGWKGEGNIDVDPCFGSRGFWWDQNDTPRKTSDDIWVEASYHLKSQAGRWGPSTQSWIQDDITSPCIDAGDPMSPIGVEFFPNGGFANLGAYGGTPEASKSYFGEPVCGTIVAGDINGDCQVNRADLEIMALHWTDDEPLLP